MLRLKIMFVISVVLISSTANAGDLALSPIINFGVAGDTYFVTDNDKRVGLERRPLSSANVFKDRFATNNVLVRASSNGSNWRANAAISTSGEGLRPKEANLSVNLIEGLWITGGIFGTWDSEYTFNR
jgi:hypothetical protein